MGRFLLLVLFVFLLGPFVFSSPETPISCRFDGKTKSYLKNNFDQGFPREVVYQCGYDCLALNGQVQSLVGVHHVSISSQDLEATRTTCQGVSVKKSKWGYDLDKIRRFYAHSSRAPEIKAWAQRAGRNKDFEALLTKKLIQDLALVINAYEKAGQGQSPIAPSFKVSADQLKKVKSQLMRKSYSGLESWLQIDIDAFSRDSASYLTLAVLHEQAYWRR